MSAYANAAIHERYMRPDTRGRKRRNCGCGCRKRTTHVGCCNGLGMMSGCEMFVRRWVRDGWAMSLPGRES